jgi:nitroreductase
MSNEAGERPISPETHDVPHEEPRLFDTIYTCRAMRRLRPDPVPQELLLHLVDAAIQGPSSSNGQNWRFVIVRDRGVKTKLAAAWRRGHAFYQDTIGQAPPRPGEDLAARERGGRAVAYLIDHLEDVPAVIVVLIKRDDAVAKVLSSPKTLVAAFRHHGLVGGLRLLAGGSRAGAQTMSATAYPAVQNLLLAARGLGLGAVLTTPHLLVPAAFEKILHIPRDVTITAVIPVGYPKGRFGPVSRPPAERVISWDTYRE